MANYKAVVNTSQFKEVVILAGKGPHYLRTYPLADGAAAFEAGTIMALNDDRELIPYTGNEPIKGILTSSVEAGAPVAKICVLGPVNAKEIKQEGSAASKETLAVLDDKNLWPTG